MHKESSVYVQRDSGRVEVFRGAEFRISTNGILCIHRKGLPNSLIRAYPEGTWVGASDSPMGGC